MKRLIAATLLLMGALNPALAEPSYYLISTCENAGEKIIDFRLWSVKIPADPRATSPHVVFGYGVTREWYTEIASGYLHTPETGSRYTDLSGQNDYLLTRGQSPFDLAIHTDIREYRTLAPERRAEYFGEYSGVNFEFGPVLQTDTGRVQVNANLLFDRTYRTETPSRLQMKYQWQAKYRFVELCTWACRGLGKWVSGTTGRRGHSSRIGPGLSSR